MPNSSEPLNKNGQSKKGIEHKDRGKERVSTSPPQLTDGVLVVPVTKKKRPGTASAEASLKGHHASRRSSKGAAGSKEGPEITVFVKSGGPLTKRISLSADGAIKSDGSACLMSTGAARRVEVADIQQFAAFIGELPPNEALALGALRAGLPDQVKVVTKAKLLNGIAQPDIIARTGDDIIYRKGQPAFALLDFDTKGMPPHVVAELKHLDGFWEAMLSVLPALRDVARVVRRSTSAGLFRSDTGEQLRGSDGLHVYLTVQDGSDIERFLRALHARCWLEGLGWMMLGAAGQLLERSIVDRMVGGPERLVFEGDPVLVLPLQQDRESRRPVAIDGGELDTVAACPPLSIVEKAKFDDLRAKEAHRLAPQAATLRAAYVEQKAKDITERTGMSMPAARRVVERQCGGVLLPDVVLPFDDDEFAGCTVANVLGDPERFVGATMADPNEGPDYGRCVAKILRRSDGTVFIHSFAHGRTFYHLKLDAAAVRTAIERADKAAAAKTLRDLFMMADLDAQELEELRDLAHTRSGINKRTIAAMLKVARQEHAERQASRSTSAVSPSAPTHGSRLPTQPRTRPGWGRWRCLMRCLAHHQPCDRRHATSMMTSHERGRSGSPILTPSPQQKPTPTQKRSNYNDQAARTRTVGPLENERNGSC
jgi:hypothetical protein